VNGVEHGAVNEIGGGSSNRTGTTGSAN
jgi:hypothetical protein